MLLLLDIDGTLVTGAAREHAAAILEALHVVHGVQATGLGIETAGRTDGWIARQILMRADVDAAIIDARAADVRAEACEQYARLVPRDLSDKVIPGVPGALFELQDAGHQLALVTGNHEPIAHLKLNRAGIGDFFPRGQGGFGSDSEDRAALPAIARRRADHHAREDTVVIGDTPHDVACALADGIRCIAVTTGAFDEAALLACGADEVVASLADVPGVL